MITKQYIYNYKTKQFELVEFNKEDLIDKNNVYKNFDKVGIYGIVMKKDVFKYRYVSLYPMITNEKFQNIVDDIIKQCNDIDFIVRELEKLGFKKLMAVSNFLYEC